GIAGQARHHAGRGADASDVRQQLEDGGAAILDLARRWRGAGRLLAEAGRPPARSATARSAMPTLFAAMARHCTSGSSRPACANRSVPLRWAAHLAPDKTTAETHPRWLSGLATVAAVGFGVGLIFTLHQRDNARR